MVEVFKIFYFINAPEVPTFENLLDEKNNKNEQCKHKQLDRNLIESIGKTEGKKAILR